MKKIEISLFLSLVLGMTSLTLNAIPNQVSTGFVNPAGMRFENFVGQEKIWSPNAKLPGKWEDWKDPKIQDSSILMYRLALTADVFGIRASQVTVQIKDDKILQFNVMFDNNSKQSASLLDQLKVNVKSFTGHEGGKDQKSFVNQQTNIRLEEGKDGSVVATFTPKASAVAAR